MVLGRCFSFEDVSLDTETLAPRLLKTVFIIEIVVRLYAGASSRLTTLIVMKCRTSLWGLATKCSNHPLGSARWHSEEAPKASKLRHSKPGGQKHQSEHSPGHFRPRAPWQSCKWPARSRHKDVWDFHARCSPSRLSFSHQRRVTSEIRITIHHCHVWSHLQPFWCNSEPDPRIISEPHAWGHLTARTRCYPRNKIAPNRTRPTDPPQHREN